MKWRRVRAIVNRLRSKMGTAQPRVEQNTHKGDFLTRIHMVVEEQLANPHFTTADAASLMSMSRMHLNRKIRSATGLSTHEFIRVKRLETARAMLLDSTIPLGVVARRVGFKSVSHFTKAFRLTFGVTPARSRKNSHPTLSSHEAG